VAASVVACIGFSIGIIMYFITLLF
jgi:hypothetical protein